MAKPRQKAAPEPLPPHLKPHSSRDGDRRGSDRLALLLRAREAQALIHADAVRAYETRERALRSQGKEDRADGIAAQATRRRGMEARARAKAEALRKEAAALLGSK